MYNRIALIPAYEPDNKLVSLVEELNNNNFIVIIVNDGSSHYYDKVFKLCKECKILEYDVNQGKGFALKTGLRYIKEKYTNYVVVTMDCDGQHCVDDAIKLVLEAENSNNTLVLGKRKRDNKVPLRSKIGNCLTRFFYRMVTGNDIYDTQTGLRAFRDDIVPFMLNIEGNRYDYEMNVLLSVFKNNIDVKEVEIQTIYINNNSNSHFRTIVDSVLVYKNIFKFVGSSLFSFIIDYFFYIVFVLIYNNVFLANILARIISATFNYNINRKIVFKSKRNVMVSLSQYMLLALFILIINSLFLNCLIYIFYVNKFIAKIIVEIILFILSYLVQHKFIFKD